MSILDLVVEPQFLSNDILGPSGYSAYGIKICTYLYVSICVYLYICTHDML